MAQTLQKERDLGPTDNTLHHEEIQCAGWQVHQGGKCVGTAQLSLTNYTTTERNTGVVRCSARPFAGMKRGRTKTVPFRLTEKRPPALHWGRRQWAGDIHHSPLPRHMPSVRTPVPVCGCGLVSGYERACARRRGGLQGQVACNACKPGRPRLGEWLRERLAGGGGYKTVAAAVGVGRIQLERN